MNDTFKIFVDQLKTGETHVFKEVLDPDFLEINEKDLSFTDKVYLKGEAYIAGDELLIHCDIKAAALMPCAVCNSPVKIPIEISNFYHAEPLAGIKTGTYFFKDVIREAILLEVPMFTECKDGQCREQEEVKRFLKKDSGPSSLQEETYRPFKDLE